MKILICASEYPPYASGAGNVVYNTVKCFKKFGHQCTICSPIGPDIKICNEKILKDLLNIRPLYYLYTILFYWWKSRRFIMDNFEDYDTILLHNINPLILWDGPIKKTRIIFVFHTTYFGHFQNVRHKGLIYLYYKYMSQLEIRALEKIKTASFIGVSPITCNELVLEGIDKEKIKYISNGVDTGRFKPFESKEDSRRHFCLPLDRVLFLTVGRVTVQKNLFVLIDTFNNIQKYRNDITLVIAGTGELTDNLTLYIKNNEIKNIIFLGYVCDIDLPSLYACSDYFVISSDYEGQPLTLLEAMASGLPCIVSNIPNLSIVKDSNSGIIVNFNDVEEASKIILHYLSSNQARLHSNNARTYAEDNLSWDFTSKEYLRHFF